MRKYFSSFHLWAARAFSDAANSIESTHSGEPRFDIRHRTYVTSSILCAVAFAEAAINEIYQDASDGEIKRLENLSSDRISLLSDYWKMTEMKNKSNISMLDKYQLALRFCGAQPFKEDRQPYQDASLCVKLRNALIHYKPESISAGLNHKLTNQLKRKFEGCKLFKGSDNPFYPDHCLSHDCSRWVLESVKLLVDEFFKEIAVKPHYDVVDFGPATL